MLNFSIPGQRPLTIENIVLDLNGTIAIDGELIPGVSERVSRLRNDVRLYLFTGDTHGNGARIAQQLGLELRITHTAEQKADEARKIGPDTTAAIGNGLIDLELFKTVRLRVLTLQAEGAHPLTLQESDIVTGSITDALDLFIKPKRLIATLRR